MREKKRWIDRLDEEDLSFLKRFTLASGSLKAVARVYGISYPTVRLRLDRLIEKIKVIESMEEVGPLEQQFRLLYADGKIDLAMLKVLRKAHEKEKEGENENADSHS
ncbi:MAG: DUF2089 family protein [Candidatus Euphemobacter frigidus]|nr:DUF2089 family protein [Candidatus Euphemobacter frigidus]MDP8275471.1 DUF2089 family protein [Candidatus Euphemobacter frigidus]